MIKNKGYNDNYDWFPLHHTQENVYYSQIIEPNSNKYNIGAYLVVNDNVDFYLFNQSWEELIKKLDVLRVEIKVLDNGQVRQRVRSQSEVDENLLYIDFSQCQNPHTEAIDWMNDQFSSVFNIDKGHFFQLALIKVGEGCCYFFARFHHILNDSLGMQLVGHYLLDLYYDLLRGNSVGWLQSLPQYTIQCEKSSAYLVSQRYQKDKQYWQRFFLDNDITRLPCYYSNTDYYTHSINVTDTLQTKLNVFCDTYNVSLLSFLLCSVAIYYNKTAAINDIVLGMPLHGRSTALDRQVVGMHVNDVLLSLSIQDDCTFLTLLRLANKSILKAMKHGHFPTSHLSRIFGEGKRCRPDLSINYDVHPKQQYSSYYLSASQGDTPLEIRLIHFMDQDKLILRINYLGRYFRSHDICSFSDSLLDILSQGVDVPIKQCTDFELLTKADKQRLLYEWNNTEAFYPQDKTLIQLIEEQVAQTPDNIALVYGNEHLTYNEVNERAKALAHTLRQAYYIAYGVSLTANTLIGLYCDMGIEMIVSILAIMKAGGAYVPISPEYPAIRTQWILEDAQLPFVITQADYKEKLQSLLDPALHTTHVLLMDHTVNGVEDDLASFCRSDDLAYVIYTSGTTGNPKGVMVEHRNIVNLAWHNLSYYDVSNDESILLLAQYVFDTSIEQMALAFLSGSRLVLPAIHFSDFLGDIPQLINRYQITHIDATASLLNGLALKDCSSLKRIVSGGERTPLALVKQFSNKLINEYGPTEITVASHQFKCLAPLTDTIVAIGKAIANTRSYVLDDRKALVPIGAIGELYIAGAGVARGYLNRHDLTKERFIDNPFATDEKKDKGYRRLYKTGDLVRYLPDGNLEFLGRNDEQVKIRGYRIELGEIETVLSKIKGIKQAVVIERHKASGAYLAAYWVIERNIAQGEPTRLDAEVLRATLIASLPDYMVPSTFTLLEAIPLTVNGKLNKSALPEPDWQVLASYAAPSNEAEHVLVAAWQRVLGIEKVGIHDNFFRLGGDSIIGIQLVSHLRKSGYHLQVGDIFEFPSIAQLALHLKSGGNKVEIKSEQGRLTGPFSLLPIQQHFFMQRFRDVDHFNQSFMLKIPADLRITDLELGLNLIAFQHDMLRNTFFTRKRGGQDIHCQTYTESTTMAPLFCIDITDFSTARLQQKLTQLQASLSLVDQVLWQVVHLTGYQDGCARLCFIFHHLIIDVVSWQIIIDDLQQVLTGHSLSTKSSSYRQWSEMLGSYGQQNQAQIPYWQQQLDIAAQIHYPALAPRSQHSVVWTHALTAQLLCDTHQGYFTEVNDLLLSALVLALGQVFNKQQVAVTLEGHGREALDPHLDLSRTVGWFTSVYPVIFPVMNTLSDTLIQVKETLRGIPDKGIGFGALGLIERNNLPPVSVNYLGQMTKQAAGKAKGLWQLMHEDCGESVSQLNHEPHLLDINGAIIDGQLHFSVMSQLSKSQSEQFIQLFKQGLIDVVALTITAANEGGRHTPSDYLAPDLNIARLSELQSRFDIEAIYAANSLQQGFIYHTLLHEEDDAYRVQLLLDYHEALNVDCYKQAWQLASIRFPVLRMAFDWQGTPLQIITSGVSLDDTHFHHIDLSHLNQDAREAKIENIQRQDRFKRFDLSKPGLMRLTLMKLSSHHYCIMQTEHHSISDGWSTAILWEYVHDIYQSLIKGIRPQIVPETAYLEAQVWQVKQQQKANDFWLTQSQQWQGVNDLSGLFTTPFDIAQSQVLGEEQACDIELTGEVFEALFSMCRMQGITLNAALQFAWHKLLQVYTGDGQTIVGTTVSGRELPVADVESSVGLYINTLPLVVNWEDDTCCLPILLAIQQSMMAINRHTCVALSRLQPQGQRLFHSLCVFENYPSVMNENNTHALTYRKSVEKTEYPLTIIAAETVQGLSIQLKFPRENMSEAQAKRLLDQLQQILIQIAQSPTCDHHALSLLSAAENKTLLQTWNDTHHIYPDQKTLAHLFEDQVLKTPQAIALVFENKKLNYEALNQRANQLAHYLRAQYQVIYQQQMPLETLIALYVDRSVDMLVAILAVLKAGGVYVPLSPEVPKVNIDFILSDTQAPLLLTQSQYAMQLTHWIKQERNDVRRQACVFSVDDERLYEHYSMDNLALKTDAENLAYVIYTSGTTGQPKGVMMPQRGVINRLHWMQSQYPLTPQDVVLQKTPYIFDVSVWELLWSSQVGACLVMAPVNSHAQVDVLYQVMIDNTVTVLHFVPSMLGAFCHTLVARQQPLPPCIKHVFCSGEALGLAHLRQFDAINGNEAQLHNLYGPTEAAIDVSFFDCHVDKRRVCPPIGRPIQNINLYVLNAGLAPVPIGAVGELYIGGVGVARGYLNRPDLTAQSFINKPLILCEDQSDASCCLYKTGDLVRYLPDGNLAFLGRSDAQVKIRGHRIELGEIEAALCTFDEVIQAAVIVKESNKVPKLVAYLVLKEAGHLYQEEEGLCVAAISYFKQGLAKTLSKVMLPSHFTRLNALPLTLNGKLDLAALPEPTFMSEKQYVAPRTELERQLCEAWQAVLGIEKVGIEDNFFQLGGDSISAIHLSSKGREITGRDIPLDKLFIFPTIDQLIAELTDNDEVVIESFSPQLSDNIIEI